MFEGTLSEKVKINHRLMMISVISKTAAKRTYNISIVILEESFTVHFPRNTKGSNVVTSSRRWRNFSDPRANSIN